MTVVAVAGGTGSVGRAIVKGLLDAKIETIIFARKNNLEVNDQFVGGARVIVVDYDNEDSLVSVLQDNKVDTIISALRPHGPQGLVVVDPEVVLIKAAEKSSVTKRYIPSIWGIHFKPEAAEFFPPAIGKLALMEILKSTSLEWTAIANGFFSDFYLDSRIESSMKPLPVFLDIENNAAALPGSGDTPVVFTHTTDIAKYVVALVLMSSKWQHTESVIIGDKLTWNEFVNLAEKVKGQKFDVKYDLIEALKQGNITELPCYTNMYKFFPKEMLGGMISGFGIMFDNGTFDLSPTASQSLNAQFPDIKPRTIKDLLEEAWGVGV